MAGFYLIFVINYCLTMLKNGVKKKIDTKVTFNIFIFIYIGATNIINKQGFSEMDK